MNENFDSLGLSEKVMHAVTAAGYTSPTEIQAQAIPVVLQKRDLIGIAQTGTGKTASFVLPMLTLLEKGRARARMPRTLILEPTRELAAQVFDNFEIYGVNHKLNVALLIGGVSFVEQNRILDRGADVLIATPGRLLDHFERGRLLMTGTELLVIDEADRMLDMGFIPDIERISALLPPRRQTLFFSATMPDEIRRLSEKFLKDPVKIQVARQNSTADTIVQKLVKTGSKPAEKRATLRQQIRNASELTNAIIFCNRKRDIATLTRSLQKHGFDAGALHGDMDQKSRMATLDAFKNDKLKFLVASDVAARGLDIPAVSHVFNFDIPTHAEDYVHRIGRTGRAGRKGASITLYTDAETKYLTAIEKLIGKKIGTVSTDQEASPGSTKVAPSSAEQTDSSPATAQGRPRRSDRGGRKKRDSDAAPAKTGAGQQKSAETGRKPRQDRKQEDRKSHDRKRTEQAHTPKGNTPFGDESAVPAFLLQSMTAH